MGGVIVAIATLMIGFVLATFGVYTNAEASQRTLIATAISSATERQSKAVQDILYELERQPTPADLDPDMFDRDSNLKVGYSYEIVGADGFVCASSNDVRPVMIEAMTMVAKTRPAAFVSGRCGDTSSTVTNNVSFSMKVS